MRRIQTMRIQTFSGAVRLIFGRELLSRPHDKIYSCSTYSHSHSDSVNMDPQDPTKDLRALKSLMDKQLIVDPKFALKPTKKDVRKAKWSAVPTERAKYAYDLPMDTMTGKKAVCFNYEPPSAADLFKRFRPISKGNFVHFFCEFWMSFLIFFFSFTDQLDLDPPPSVKVGERALNNLARTLGLTTITHAEDDGLVDDNDDDVEAEVLDDNKCLVCVKSVQNDFVPITFEIAEEISMEMILEKYYKFRVSTAALVQESKLCLNCALDVLHAAKIGFTIGKHSDANTNTNHESIVKQISSIVPGIMDRIKIQKKKKTCAMCGKKCNRKRDMNHHLEKQHFKCKYCNYMGTSANATSVHITTDHPGKRVK